MLDLEKYPQLGWFLTLFAVPYGAVFGSFLNMAIYRVPRRISVVKKTRSFCPKCGHVIAWYHNIPILSYLFLKGRTERLPDPSVDTRGYAAAHRDQLLAQARLLKTAPLWYLAPLALGAFGLIAHAAVEVSAAGRGGMWIVISSGLICAATFGAVAVLNVRKAAQLKRRAESMDS